MRSPLHRRLIMHLLVPLLVILPAMAALAAVSPAGSVVNAPTPPGLKLALSDVPTLDPPDLAGTPPTLPSHIPFSWAIPGGEDVAGGRPSDSTTSHLAPSDLPALDPQGRAPESQVAVSLPGDLDRAERSASVAPRPGARVVDAASGAPIAGAWVSDGVGLVQSGRDGSLTLPGDGELRVVAPGYWPATVPGDGSSIALPTITARAIYLPYEQLWRPESLAWLLELARDGLINAVVIDIKEEGGGVLPLAATPAVHALGAVVDPGTDVVAVLDDLERLGIYRIARVVTFLDRRLATAYPADAIRLAGGQLLDNGVYAWSHPARERARAYNLEIALAAAPHFEEILFDYIRFPGNSRLRFEPALDEPQRRAAIRSFSQEAAEALHRRGVAVSIAGFGRTAIIFDDGGIGQVLEDLAPLVEYFAPMLYPSTWPPGSFNLLYPAAYPGEVVRRSTAAAVARAAAVGGALVRPWLQDFRDYGSAAIPYGTREVNAQIEAAHAAGAAGFMLWDPSLHYALDALRAARP